MNILNEDIKKRHHYLPIVYLEQWVNNNMLHIRKKDNKEYKSSPKNDFFKKDLNTLSFISEKQILIIETLYSDFLNSNLGKSTNEFIKELYKTSRLIKEYTIEEFKKHLLIQGKNNITIIHLCIKDNKELNKIKKVFLSNLIEGYFSEAETTYGNFIKNLTNNKSPDASITETLKEKGISSLLNFLILQKYRGIKFLELQKIKLETISKEHKLSEKELSNLVIISAYIEHKIFIANLSNHNIHIDIVKNTSNEYFLSSDSPWVTVTNEFKDNNEIIIDYIFPISPSYLVTITILELKQIKEKDNCENISISICYGELNNISLINNINELISNSSYQKLILPPI